jgi:hypothetical protein
MFTIPRKGLQCSYARRRGVQAAQHDVPQSSNSSQLQKTSIGPYFVDSALFNRWRIELPRIDHWLSEKVRDIIHDVETIHNISELYFGTTHKWLPIVSQRQFYQALLPMSAQIPDLYLLSLCMKLMISIPDDACLRCYQVARDAITKGTSAVHLSMFVVQASILLAVFELAHGLYPAAYISIGISTRLATALRCDSSIIDPELRVLSHETEERRRIWWAVLVLDR